MPSHASFGSGARRPHALRLALTAAAAALVLSGCASEPAPGPRAASHAHPMPASGAAPLGATGVARFDARDSAFKGRVMVVDTPVVLAGQPVTLAGRDFTPGQRVSLSYGGALLGEVATVAPDGTFRTRFTLPADAAAGRYQLVASATGPAASLLVPLKISPVVPLAGQERFDVRFSPLVPGLYQVAYSPKSGRAFVTSTAGGRPPAPLRSELLRIDPATLAIEARLTPAAAPAAPAALGGGAGAPQPFAVYGVGVDDAHGTVWVTNTRQNTVAVYRQSDLALLKQFEPGAVPHARDVIVDQRQGKAYAGATGTPNVVVFDARGLARLKTIAVASAARGQGAREFSPMSMALDEAGSRLFVASMTTNELAVIDTRTDAVVALWPLAGASEASGVAYDPRGERVFVAAQGSDNLLILDARSGTVLHDVPTGAGPLNVTFDPVRRLAYVANRASGNITVVDPDGRVVASLGAGTFPNHLTSDGKGAVFTVNKSRGENDPEGDRIGRIAPR